MAIIIRPRWFLAMMVGVAIGASVSALVALAYVVDLRLPPLAP